MSKLPDISIPELSPAHTTVQRALADGFRWKQAVYIAWASHTPKARKESNLPSTPAKLALLLGSTARDPANVFRQWRRRYTADDGTPMDDYIDRVGARSILRHYRPEVLAAAVETAMMIGREGHADRKMVLEMTGDYRQGSDVDVTSQGKSLTEIRIEYADPDPS